MQHRRKSPNSAPSIFEFDNYRSFLQAQVRHLQQEKKMSMRNLVKRCGFRSPNYLKLIIEEKKNVSVRSASGVAEGLFLKGDEGEYFVHLVKLTHGTHQMQLQALGRMRGIIARQGRKKVADQSIHNSWIHQVVYECVRLEDFEASMEYLVQRIGHLASKKEIQESLDFLLNKGWIFLGDRGKYCQGNIEFEVTQDIRNIDIQKSHRSFLDAARHRLSDNLPDREFQGLTLAIPAAKRREIAFKLREFFNQIHEEYQDNAKCTEVVHLQGSLFKLTKSQPKE